MNIFLPPKKTLVLLCLLFVPLLALKAQNWHPFPGNGPIFYWFEEQSISPDSAFYAARIDSVRLEGGDSAYYFYRMDRPMYDNEVALDCNGAPFTGTQFDFLSNADHYFGKKMLLNSNGIARFISTMGDTFTLQLNAPLGSTWNWTAGVSATVTNASLGTVLGVADSLKTIALSNGKNIVLSKDHGFVDTYSFLPFAEDNAQIPMRDFHLFGIPAMSLGRSLPNSFAINSFQVNDRFCRYGNHWEINPRFSKYSNVHITSIEPCPNPTYGQIQEFYSEQYFYLQPTVYSYSPPTPYTQLCQPITSDDTILNLLPYESNSQQKQAITRHPYGYTTHWIQRGFQTDQFHHQRIQSLFWGYELPDTCTNLFPRIFETTFSQSFADGLGLLEFHYRFSNEETYDEYLEAYEKGLETYGTCPDLHALKVQEDAVAQFSISPNPASNIVQITMENVDMNNPTELRIMNAEGRLLMRTNFPVSSTTIQLFVSDLPSGLYLLEIYQDDAVGLRKKLVIAR